MVYEKSRCQLNKSDLKTRIISKIREREKKKADKTIKAGIGDRKSTEKEKRLEASGYKCSYSQELMCMCIQSKVAVSLSLLQHIEDGMIMCMCEELTEKKRRKNQ